MGFFDGLKRDTKQARTVEEVDQPQTQEQEVVAAEEELVDDPENIEVVVREVEEVDNSDQPWGCTGRDGQTGASCRS